jgi:hypothetical protein
MPDSEVPKANPDVSKLNIWIAVITVIGSVLVAIVTTVGTIASSGSSIRETSEQVNSLKKETSSLRLSALPVGSIIPSLLNVSEFAKEAGDPSTFDLSASKWTLADGKSVPGTHYAELTGNAPLPDLRGVFLRGKNNGRTDGRGNSQELNLGDFQDDQFQDHVHEYNRGGVTQGGSELYAMPGNTNGGVPRAPTNYIIQGKHGDETRPRNVTVNYYVRIN